MTTDRSPTAEIAISAPRQPPSHAASGTARAAAAAAPSWMPVAYAPVPVAGRAAKRSLTAIGASAFPRPMPMPTGHVSSTTSHADGATARRMPKRTDQDEADRHRPPRADSGREERGHRSEQAHAENGDRAKQAGDGMRGVEVVLDARDQRADRDDLRPKRQRREEQRGERRCAGSSSHSGAGGVWRRSPIPLSVRLSVGRASRRTRRAFGPPSPPAPRSPTGSPPVSRRAARPPRPARSVCRTASA